MEGQPIPPRWGEPFPEDLRIYGIDHDGRDQERNPDPPGPIQKYKPETREPQRRADGTIITRQDMGMIPPTS